MDRSKTFYSDKAGFKVDVDHRAGEDFRIIQLTPPGSACSITLMRNEAGAGSMQGLHLIVHDIEAARGEMAGRGAEVSEFFHFDAGGQAPGLDPVAPDSAPTSRSAIPTATAGWSRKYLARDR